MSRKATVVALSRTMVAGMSPVTILQNRQSVCGSPAMARPPRSFGPRDQYTGMLSVRPVENGRLSAPAAGASHQQGRRGRPRGRGAQHAGAEPVRTALPPRRRRPAPAGRRRPPGRRPARSCPSAGSSAVASGSLPLSRSSCRTPAKSAPASRAATCLVVMTSATSGNRTRRDCFPASRAVLRHLARDFRPAVALPLRDAARGLPGHDRVDAGLGHRLHGQLAAVALGQRLDDGDAGCGRGLLADRP